MYFLDSDWFIQYLSKYWRVWIRGCLNTGCTPKEASYADLFFQYMFLYELTKIRSTEGELHATLLL